MKWFAQAPANIALIKYMGKVSAQTNLPTNNSLSFTLNHLLSSVELETSQHHEDTWQPLLDNCRALQLNHNQQQRYLSYLQKIKHHFNYSGNFIVRSGNNFPADCGLASSASSFAALTLCAVKALSELTGITMSLQQQAQLSREASGSSCRSFFSPWALWTENSVEAVSLPYTDLVHQVIVVDDARKQVTSSAAHQLIQTSLLFSERAARANARLDQLLTALQSSNWAKAYEITWQEFWDMHSLFETSTPPFSYMTPDSLAVLRYLQDYWHTHQDGAIITMDAGANIHLLYRLDQQAIFTEIHGYFAKKYKIITSPS